MSARSLGAVAIALAAASSVALATRPAEAHLMAAQHGTLRVLDGDVFAVLSIPVSALHGFDDDGDGVMSLAELERHQDALRGEIDRRVAIADGEGVRPRTVRVDLVLAPDHEAAQDRAGQVVALEHVAFGAAPAHLRIGTDLFGTRDPERSLTITASHGPARADAETTQLSPTQPEHAFFAVPAAAAAAAPSSRAAVSWLETPLAARNTSIAISLAVAGALAWALVRRPRRTLPSGV